MVASLSGKISVKTTLNESNFDNYVYPSRYNDEREKTRYFAFEFIDEDEIYDGVDWTVKSEKIDADGVIYGIIPKKGSSIEQLKKTVLNASQGFNRHIFIVTKKYIEIDSFVR